MKMTVAHLAMSGQSEAPNEPREKTDEACPQRSHDGLLVCELRHGRPRACCPRPTVNVQLSLDPPALTRPTGTSIAPNRTCVAIRAPRVLPVDG